MRKIIILLAVLCLYTPAQAKRVFYDDFEDGAIDSRWYDCTESESGGLLRLSGGTHCYFKNFGISLSTMTTYTTICSPTESSTNYINFILANTTQNVYMQHRKHMSSGGTPYRWVKVWVNSVEVWSSDSLSAAPKYLKMIYTPVRKVDCYYSEDGITWILVYTVNFDVDFIPTYAGYTAESNEPCTSTAGYFLMESSSGHIITTK